LGARIEEEFGITPELIEGSGGVFRVTIDGTAVFSDRGARNLIPGNEKLVEMIRKHLDGL